MSLHPSDVKFKTPEIQRIWSRIVKVLDEEREAGEGRQEETPPNPVNPNIEGFQMPWVRLGISEDAWLDRQHVRRVSDGELRVRRRSGSDEVPF